MQLVVSGACTPEQIGEYFAQRANPVTEIIVMSPANPLDARRIRDCVDYACKSGLVPRCGPGGEKYLPKPRVTS